MATEYNNIRAFGVIPPRESPFSVVCFSRRNSSIESMRRGRSARTGCRRCSSWTTACVKKWPDIATGLGINQYRADDLPAAVWHLENGQYSSFVGED